MAFLHHFIEAFLGCALCISVVCGPRDRQQGLAASRQLLFPAWAASHCSTTWWFVYACRRDRSAWWLATNVYMETDKNVLLVKLSQRDSNQEVKPTTDLWGARLDFGFWIFYFDLFDS